jgi:hypothetical protein
MLLAICGMAFAQGKPKIAVYVANDGLKDAEKKMLSTKILSSFIQSGQYGAIERGDAFLENISRERKKQRDGSVNDNQISRLGKEAGVQFVCVADLVEAFGMYNVSARLIDVESAEIVGLGETEIKNVNEIGKAANEIFEQIHGKKTSSSVHAYQQEPKQKPETEIWELETKQNPDSDYKNFTKGQRWGTWGLNLAVPGLGSWVIMKDVAGGFVHLGLALTSIYFLFDAILEADSNEDCYYSSSYNYYCETYYEPDLSSFWISSLLTGAWNIYRSVSYDKPQKRYGLADPGNFRFAVLPTKNGNGVAYGLRYNYGF